MFSLDFSFIKLHPLFAQNAQRDSFVRVLNPAITLLDGDIMPMQFKSVDAGYRLADLFFDTYETDSPATALDKSNLQEWFLGAFTTNISLAYYNQAGVFQYRITESRQVVSTVENIVIGLRYGYSAVADGLYYFVLEFLTPAVLPAGLEDYLSQYVPLLKSDYIYLKTSPVTKNELGFYTLLEYRNNQRNAFDWVYGYVYAGEVESYTNKVRIPVELRNPQFKMKVENYRKSNGMYVRLTSESEKEYSLETENSLDVSFHEALSVALLHEDLRINSVQYFQNQDYEVVYNPDRLQVGKGRTKVVLSPYNTVLPKF